MTSASAASPETSESAVISRLPAMVGRDREIQALLALSANPANRLITLTGPGGAGKTRLVVHVAGLAAPRFPAGVWLIPLSTVQDPALVVPAIAEAVAAEVPDPTVSVATVVNARLDGRRGLVVLDNAEHVISAATSLASLLAQCPDLTILATSRERFRITGEQAFVVPPLTLPPNGATQLDQIAISDAVQLYVSRAEAIAPGFRLTAGNAADVAEICRQLDGLPLALELAAARADVLSPSALLTRLERRLVLLTGGSRDQPERLRTMRNAISWSHDLLSSDEQVLFRRLAVFSGGFSLEAAESVCASRPGDPAPAGSTQLIDTGDVLDGIISLVEKSLIRPYDGPNDERRFRMLQTIRDYASERLEAAGERAMVVTRLAEWVSDLVEQAHTGLRESDQPRWLATLDAEAGNIRVALAAAAGDEVATSGGSGQAARFDPVLILRLTGFMWRYWALRGRRREGHDWLIRALAMPGVEHAPLFDRALASLILGNFERAVGNVRGAREAYETALELWQADGDTEGVADAKTNLALLSVVGGDYVTARHLLEETLVLRQQNPLPYSIALTIGTLAETAVLEQDFDRGERLAREAIGIRETIGDHNGIAYSQHLLAEIALRRGELAVAQGLIDESLRAFSRIEDQVGRSLAYRVVGHIATEEDGPGRPERAAAAYRQALSDRIAVGDQVGMVECLIDVAWLIVQAATANAPVPPEAIESVAMIVGTIEDYFQRSMMVPTPFDRPRLAETRAFLASRPAGSTATSAGGLSLPVDSIAERAASLLAGFSGTISSAPAPPTAPAGKPLPQESMIEVAVQEHTPLTVTSVSATASPDAARTIEPIRLTRREKQVLTLVASGRLDREIAEELFISHRTVTTHVTAILAKMSVSSRTAAAATAVRLGMV